MKKIFDLFKKIFRILIISLFYSYYVVAIILNYNKIESILNPLKLFGLSKIERVENIYLSTYPSFNDLKRYKKQFNIKKVIAIFNPSLPFIKELVKLEQKNCKKLGIKFNVISFENIKNLNKLLSKENILINRYFFDSKLKKIKNYIKRVQYGALAGKIE